MRRVQSLRDQNINFLEGDTSGFVRIINTAELTDEYTDSELGKVVSSIKAAKASKNHVQGEISKILSKHQDLDWTL